ncbi:hypothetical protein MKW98_031310 [Papaver atlanticum]|uniref:Uncharacterized protein n=1 Tax=Papaver atlanticum TaxID=357466 RepID=A0AAD4S5K9_9MAGN|nr:hypothetical protein MKW98_031310 [Papaver atlanticum]
MATPDGEGIEVCMRGKDGPSVRLEGGAYHNYLIQYAVALVLLAVPPEGGAYHKYLIQCVVALVLVLAQFQTRFLSTEDLRTPPCTATTTVMDFFIGFQPEGRAYHNILFNVRLLWSWDFVWHDREGNHKMHVIGWVKIFCPMTGGLGI